MGRGKDFFKKKMTFIGKKKPKRGKRRALSTFSPDLHRKGTLRISFSGDRRE